MDTFPSLQSVYRARQRISGIAIRTPLVASVALAPAGKDVRFKLETAQPTGAFKIRGAANALAGLSSAEAASGVVCASTGNHGRAVSFAAARLGIKATVCMSQLVPANKVEAIRALGARVVIVGNSQDDAQAEADRLSATEGLTQVPPFDHPDVIAGQGTIALEIIEDFTDVDTILVPLSGGGLISGIALVAKAVDRNIRVVGIGIENCPAMQASLQAGQPVEVEEKNSLADSLGGGIGLQNRYTLALTRRYVDDTVLVSERQVAAAMAALFSQEGWVCEGAGAVGIAALMDEGLTRLGSKVAIVLSGRNVDMGDFKRICL